MATQKKDLRTCEHFKKIYELRKFKTCGIVSMKIHITTLLILV